MDSVENVTTRALEPEPQAPVGSPADPLGRLGAALLPALFAVGGLYNAYALAAHRVSWGLSVTLHPVLVALCIGQAAAAASLAWAIVRSRWSWRRYAVWAVLFVPLGLTFGTVHAHARGMSPGRILPVAAAGTTVVLVSIAWNAARLFRPAA